MAHLQRFTDIQQLKMMSNWLFGAHFELKVSWAPSNGDRGSAQIRIVKKSAAGASLQMYTPPNTHYLRNHHANVNDIGFEEVTPIDLDTGEYIVIEGAGARQLAGAGDIQINHLLTNFWRMPREATVVSTPSSQQQVSRSLAPKEFRRWRRAPINTTPTLPLGFDGVVWTGATGWNEYPVTGVTPADQQVYHGQGEAVYNPLATFDWTVRNVSVEPADRVRFSTVRNPTSNSQITSTPTCFWRMDKLLHYWYWLEQAMVSA